MISHILRMISFLTLCRCCMALREKSSFFFNLLVFLFLCESEILVYWSFRFKVIFTMLLFCSSSFDNKFLRPGHLRQWVKPNYLNIGVVCNWFIFCLCWDPKFILSQHIWCQSQKIWLFYSDWVFLGRQTHKWILHVVSLNLIQLNTKPHNYNKQVLSLN